MTEQIPIADVRMLAEKLGHDVVVVLSYNEQQNSLGVATYGRNPVHKLLGAHMGQAAIHAAGGIVQEDMTQHADFRCEQEAAENAMLAQRAARILRAITDGKGMDTHAVIKQWFEDASKCTIKDMLDT